MGTETYKKEGCVKVVIVLLCKSPVILLGVLVVHLVKARPALSILGDC